MVRDTRADEKYFTEYLYKEKSSIIRLEDCILKEARPEFVLRHYDTITWKKLKMLMIRYSRGDELEELREDFLEILPDCCKYWNSTVFSDALDCLTLGVLFQVEQEYFELMGATFSKYKIGRKTNDWMLNFLMNSRVPEIEYKDTKPVFKSFLKYKEAVESENPKEALYAYVKRWWYNGQRGNWWWASDKVIGKGMPQYYGYWAFDIAAIVRILGIDDSDWNDLVYYPYDLARFRMDKQMKRQGT